MLARRRRFLLVATGLAATGLAACGSGASAPQGTSRASTIRSATHPRRRSIRQPRVGTTERVHAGGATLAVTLTGVIDPLLGSGAALPPGTHAIGVVVRIQNRGPGIYDSSATGDISVAPSSGSATPVFAPHGPCQTPLRDFDNYITAGEVRHGCVAFAIDAGAKPLAVRFSAHGRAAGHASWTNAR